MLLCYVLRQPTDHDGVVSRTCPPVFGVTARRISAMSRSRTSVPISSRRSPTSITVIVTSSTTTSAPISPVPVTGPRLGSWSITSRLLPSLPTPVPPMSPSLVVIIPLPVSVIMLTERGRGRSFSLTKGGRGRGAPWRLMLSTPGVGGRQTH